MEINATFIIQIINFYITYHVLHHWLLKPFVAFLIKKEMAQHKLIESLKSKDSILVLLQEEKKKDLIEFKSYLSKHYVPEPALLHSAPPDVFHIHDQDEVKKLTHDLQEILITKGPHAY